MRKAKIRNFKGLHTTQDKKQLQPNFGNVETKLPTCNNFMPGYDGSLSKVTGGVRVNTAYPTPIKPIHEYRLSTGEIFALFWANNLLYNENISTGVISQITIPAGITITGNGYFSDTFADKLYYSDGTNELLEIFYTPSTGLWTVQLASMQPPSSPLSAAALSANYIQSYSSLPIDLTTWTSRTSGTALNLYGITYGNGLFVTVGGSAIAAIILTSTDGITWTPRTSAFAGRLYGITYGNGLFVICSYDTGTIQTSPDGITWTLRHTSATYLYYDIAWSGTKFVAVSTGGYVTTSTDGITWVESSTVVTGNAIRGIVWSGTQFVACTGLGGGGDIITSPDGTTWTNQVIGTTNALLDITWSGTQFIAVGDTGTIITSPDGITWTNRTAPSTNNLTGICWTGHQYIAVSSAGTYATSTDGITWAQTTLSGGHNAIGGQLGKLFIIVGTGGEIYTSSGVSVTNIVESGDWIYCLYTSGTNIYLAQFDSYLNLNQTPKLLGTTTAVGNLLAVDGDGNPWVNIDNGGWRIQQYKVSDLTTNLYKTINPAVMRNAADGTIYAGWSSAGVVSLVRIRTADLIAGQPTLYTSASITATGLSGFDIDIQQSTGDLLVAIGGVGINKVYKYDSTFITSTALIFASSAVTATYSAIRSSSLYTYLYSSDLTVKIYDNSNALLTTITLTGTGNDFATIEDDLIARLTNLVVYSGNGNIVTPTVISTAVTKLGYSVGGKKVLYSSNGSDINTYEYPIKQKTSISGVTSVSYLKPAASSNNIYVQNGGNITEIDITTNKVGRQWVGNGMAVDTNNGDKIYSATMAPTAYGNIPFMSWMDAAVGTSITASDLTGNTGQAFLTLYANLATPDYFIVAGKFWANPSPYTKIALKYYNKNGTLAKTISGGVGYCVTANSSFAAYLYTNTTETTRNLAIQTLATIATAPTTLDITAVSTNLNGIAIDTSNNVYTLSGSVLKKYNSSLVLQATYSGAITAPTAANTRCLSSGSLVINGVSTEVLIISSQNKTYILDTSFNLIKVHTWETGEILNAEVKDNVIYSCINYGGIDAIGVLALYDSGVGSGIYTYEYTYYNSTSIKETTGSPASIPLNLVNQTPILTLPVSSVSKRIYRNINGTYYLIGEIAAGATRFIDRVSDEQALLQNITIPLYNFPAPKGLKYLTAHKNYLFGTNTSNQVVFSELGDATIFPPQNLLQAPNNQGVIKAIKSSLLDHLLIFQDDAITHIAGTGYGYSNQYTNDLGFYQYTSSKTVGTINHNTIRITDTPEGAKCYFLSDKGIYEYGGQQPQPIHLGIIPTYKSINSNGKTLATAGINPATNEYWLCVPITATTYNDKVLVWNYGLREWYFRDDCYSAITAVEGANGYEMRGGWSTSATNGYFHKLQGQYYQGINYTGTLTGGVLSPAPTIDMTGLPATNGTVFTMVTSITGSTPTFASAIPDGPVYIGDIYANCETPDINFGDAFMNKQIRWLQINNTGTLNITPTICDDVISGTDRESTLTKISGLTGLSKRYMGGVFSHYRLKFDSWDFNACSLQEVNYMYDELNSVR